MLRRHARAPRRCARQDLGAPRKRRDLGTASQRRNAHPPGRPLQPRADREVQGRADRGGDGAVCDERRAEHPSNRRHAMGPARRDRLIRRLPAAGGKRVHRRRGHVCAPPAAAADAGCAGGGGSRHRPIRRTPARSGSIKKGQGRRGIGQPGQG